MINMIDAGWASVDGRSSALTVQVVLRSSTCVIHTRKGGKLYRYFVSQTVLKHGAGSCPVGRVPAGKIEAAVIDQLRAVLRQPEVIAGTCEQARIVALLVERVDIGTDGLDIRLRVDGLTGLAREMMADTGAAA